MDHVAGSYAAKKGFLDKKWFAPDCKDAGTNIMRLAKYLEICCVWTGQRAVGCLENLKLEVMM